MAKGDYYFPLYYKRLLASTVGWKDDEFGCYLKLLIYQFDNGSIPADIDDLSRIAPSVKKHWHKLLSKKFKDDGNGGLVNEVMQDIYNEVQAQKERNSKNGRKGGRPKNNPNETDRFNVANPNETDPITETKPISITNNQQPKENTVFNKKNLDEPLTEIESGASIEFFSITLRRPYTAERVGELWKAFLIQTEKNFYTDRPEKIKHFRNWVKTQPYDTTQRNTFTGAKRVTKSTGAHQLADLLKTELTSPEYPGGQDNSG